ncbi:MAG: hypothetical protein U1F36_15090 [Planctomycetota bacterium]
MKQTEVFACVAVLACASLAATQQIVDVSALTNDTAHPVVVTLQPGLWRVVAIDPTQSGAYTAWHAWNGQNVGCSATPGGCTQGWMWNYFIQCPGMPSVKVGAVFGGIGAPKFATEGEAFATAPEHWFPLTTPTAVSFWIGDSNYQDNLGGVSLRIDSATPIYPTMTATPAAISVSAGGPQNFDIQGGALRAGHTYLVVGSSSGTSPGLSAMHWHLPLNGPDGYLGFTLAFPNNSLLVNTMGTLDAAGAGHASFVLPPGQDPALVGFHLWHACLTVNRFGITGISSATQLDFVQ